MPYKTAQYKGLGADTIRALNHWESKGWRVVGLSVTHAARRYDVEVLLHKEAED